MFVFDCLLMLHIKVKVLCSFLLVGFYWLLYLYYGDSWILVTLHVSLYVSTIAQGMYCCHAIVNHVLDFPL